MKEQGFLGNRVDGDRDGGICVAPPPVVQGGHEFSFGHSEFGTPAGLQGGKARGQPDAEGPETPGSHHHPGGQREPCALVSSAAVTSATGRVASTA